MIDVILNSVFFRDIPMPKLVKRFNFSSDFSEKERERFEESINNCRDDRIASSCGRFLRSDDEIGSLLLATLESFHKPMVIRMLAAYLFVILLS